MHKKTHDDLKQEMTRGLGYGGKKPLPHGTLGREYGTKNGRPDFIIEQEPHLQSVGEVMWPSLPLLAAPQPRAN